MASDTARLARRINGLLKLGDVIDKPLIDIGNDIAGYVTPKSGLAAFLQFHLRHPGEIKGIGFSPGVIQVCY